MYLTRLQFSVKEIIAFHIRDLKKIVYNFHSRIWSINTKINNQIKRKLISFHVRDADQGRSRYYVKLRYNEETVLTLSSCAAEHK